MDRALGCEAAAEAWSAAGPLPLGETGADGGLADGASPGGCKGPHVVGGVHHVAL